MIKRIWHRSRKNKIIIATVAVAWIIYAASWQMLDKGIPAIVAWIASGVYLTLVWNGNRNNLIKKYRYLR